MRKWLYDRPWIWIVVLLGSVVAASIVTVIIAQLNRPEIVKPKRERRPTAQTSVLVIDEVKVPNILT